MSAVTVTVLGCGDAFNSGARRNACFHVRAGETSLLLDCGPTALLAMKLQGIDPDSIDAVLLSHFHGDHYGGVPALELELAILRRRSRPLVIAGPPAVAEWVSALRRELFPGTTSAQRLALEFVEWDVDRPVSFLDVRVASFPAVHVPETRPHALRVEVGGRIVAYSGDTEWTPGLVEAAADADLFICECSTYATKVTGHLDFQTLQAHRAELSCQRLMITHMSDEMLSRLPIAGLLAAEDGLFLTV